MCVRSFFLLPVCICPPACMQALAGGANLACPALLLQQEPAGPVGRSGPFWAGARPRSLTGAGPASSDYSSPTWRHPPSSLRCFRGSAQHSSSAEQRRAGGIGRKEGGSGQQRKEGQLQPRHCGSRADWPGAPWPAGPARAPPIGRRPQGFRRPLPMVPTLERRPLALRPSAPPPAG